MQRTKSLLRTTFRDVRVTDHTPAKVWLATSSIAVAFAAALCNRFARRTRFVSGDLSLRRSRALLTLLRQVRNLQINLSPRFQLTSQPEKHYRIVERQTDNRVLPSIGPSLPSDPPVERILQRLAFYATPHRAPAHSPGSKVTATHPAVEITLKRLRADSDSPPLYRRAPVSFAPVEMVTHQPRRVSSVSAEPEREIERAQPRSDHWPTEERHRSTTPIEAINIKQLTDQVVDALDRRQVAGHERITRR